MGLFSSKKKVTVDTAVSRVIQDNLLPDSPKQGVIAALFSNDDQMVEHIMESVVGSVGVKAERMYRYGKQTYLYGLPRSTLFANTTGQDATRGVLGIIENQGVDIEYHHLGAPNNLHYGWQTLVNSYGYNPSSNEITSLSAVKGSPVYLHDLQVIVAEATVAELNNGSLAQWGPPATGGYTPMRPVQREGSLFYRMPKHTPFGTDAAAASDYFRVTYIWMTGRTPHYETLTFPMGNLDPTADYFQVKYSFLEEGHLYPTIKYWTYRSGEGTWPTLDDLLTTAPNQFGEFFPIGYFRYNKTPTSTNVNSTEYKHSKKLMSYLSMDYDTVRDAVNQNPDIEDVESALLMMAVPASTTNPMEQRYLFDFFKNLYLKLGEVEYPFASSDGFEQAAAAFFGTLFGGGPEVSLVIQDARFKMSVNLSGLYYRRKAGTIGAKGAYSGGYALREIVQTGIAYADENDTTGTPTTATFQQPCYFYRHQVTEGIYEEIQVYGLQDRYWVSGSYTDAAYEGDASLLIPVDHEITEHYSASDREELYARSLHYIFNTKIVTKVKWYQSGWFKMVLIVVAVVISILSFNPGPLVAAVAAGGMALATFIATTILKGLLFSIAFKLFVKMVGTELAMLVAVLATVYSLGAGMMNGGSLQGVPWGEELLQVASGITNAANDALQKDMLGLQNEMEDFQSFMEDQNEELKRANKLLENQTLLNPFVVFGESPSDYYERTVHSGNIGVIGLDAVTHYCDVALTLPRLSQTLGDSFNTEAFSFNSLG